MFFAPNALVMWIVYIVFFTSFLIFNYHYYFVFVLLIVSLLLILFLPFYFIFLNNLHIYELNMVKIPKTQTCLVSDDM